MTANCHAAWKSSNSKIFTVSQEGVIRGKKQGIAALTVCGLGQTKKIKVHVGKRIRSLKIIHGRTTIWVRSKADFDAAISPSRAISKGIEWQSSNSKYDKILS